MSGYNAERYAANKEKYQAAKKRYYEKNKEQISARQKERRKTDEEFRERERGYRSVQSERNGEKMRETNRRYGLLRYGLTPEQYDSMLAEQENKCAICGAEHVDEPKKRLHVDHDHAAGFKAVRGLLCGKCNLGIGMFGEDQDRLIKAIEYLKGFQK